jgi:hypothetical protein
MDIIIFLKNVKIKIMNIIDIIDNNYFLKQLYPNGLQKMCLSHIKVDCFKNIAITLQTTENPNIEIKKWGQWGANYNVIAIDITSNMMDDFYISNWGKSKLENCECKIELFKENENSHFNNIYNVIFYTEDWNVKISTKSFTYQESRVYILDEE